MVLEALTRALARPEDLYSRRRVPSTCSLAQFDCQERLIVTHSRKVFFIILAFLAPILLSGLVLLPISVFYAMGSLMMGWPPILIPVILIGGLVLISFVPKKILMRLGLQPRRGALIFLVSFGLNAFAFFLTMYLINECQCFLL